MKRLFSIVIFSCIFLQSTSMLWTVGGFYLNRDFIAKNRCINRNKPGSGCNGACQLKKKLEKNQEDNKKSGTTVKQKEINLYMVQALDFPGPADPVPKVPLSFNSRYKSLIAQDFIASVFHPPARV